MEKEHHGGVEHLRLAPETAKTEAPKHNAAMPGWHFTGKGKAKQELKAVEGSPLGLAIQTQADKVRALKATGTASKPEIREQVDILLALKGELEFSPDGGVTWVPAEEREPEPEAAAAAEEKDEEMSKPDDGIDWLDDEDDDDVPQDMLENGMEWEDEDDDGEGWLNPENIDEAVEEAGLTGQTTDLLGEEQEMVGCVTTDFAMQNVMLQIGLNVVSVDGMMVRRVTTYVLKCEACFKTTDEMEAQFCPNCGNNTLYKVATTVNADGKVAHNALRKRYNLRGTKFSIPMPKGGRNNDDLLLREDQLPKRSRKSKEADLMDNDTSGWTFSYKNKAHGQKSKVGYGRKNPNEKRAQVTGKKTGR